MGHHKEKEAGRLLPVEDALSITMLLVTVCILTLIQLELNLFMTTLIQSFRVLSTKLKLMALLVALYYNLNQAIAMSIRTMQWTARSLQRIKPKPLNKEDQILQFLPL